MAVFTLFSHAINQSYKTTLCSKATVFYLISSVLSVIIPLLIAYKSEGFWRKYDLFREHPNVHFKHQLLVVLETGDGNKPIVWSTFQNMNLKDTAKGFQVENFEDDVDDDGLNDKLEMLMTISVPAGGSILSVTMLLIFDYRLQETLDLQMESLIYIYHSTCTSSSLFSLTGDLRFNQKEPVTHHGFHNKYNTSIIDFEKLGMNFDLETILKSYSSRTLTTHLSNEFPLWKAGRGPEQKFTVKLNVLYPEETILCRLGFWQLLKWAWIQYISILLVTLYIAHKAKVFIFQHQVFPTIVAATYKQHYS